MATEKDYAVLEDTKRLGLLAKIKQWWLRLIREEYHLTVYFVVAAVSNPETGEKTVTRTKKTFKLKSVNKTILQEQILTATGLRLKQLNRLITI
jgi:hypothetical protein